jgi:hypothetical protein
MRRAPTTQFSARGRRLLAPILASHQKHRGNRVVECGSITLLGIHESAKLGAVVAWTAGFRALLRDPVFLARTGSPRDPSSQIKSDYTLFFRH